MAVETTGSRTLECHSLPSALDAVPADEIKEVTVKIRTGRRRLITIVWRCDGTGHIVVSGASPIWVRGMRGVLEDFLVERGYAVDEPSRASWRQYGWRSFSIQVVAGIVGTVLFTLAVALWKLVT